MYRKFERLPAMAGHLPPSWRLTRGLFNVAIVVDVGGAGGIVPRRNIVFRNVILRFGPVLPLLIYLIHLVL